MGAASRFRQALEGGEVVPGLRLVGRPDMSVIALAAANPKVIRLVIFTVKFLTMAPEPIITLPRLLKP